MSPHIKIYYYDKCFIMTNLLNIFTNSKVNIDLDNLENTHKLVWEEAKNGDLEDYFKRFNSDKNPLSNKKSQDYIKKNKLHTSMSVGDILMVKDDNKENYFLCRGISWAQLEKNKKNEK